MALPALYHVVTTTQWLSVHYSVCRAVSVPMGLFSMKMNVFPSRIVQIIYVSSLDICCLYTNVMKAVTIGRPWHGAARCVCLVAWKTPRMYIQELSVLYIHKALRKCMH